jgi:hypothetical protein
VHVPTVWRGAAIAAASCALVAAGMTSALAQPAQAPVVTISTQSAIPPITHDVFVIYKVSQFRKGTHHRLDTVDVSGTVSSSTAGQVVALFAQPFPYKAKPAQVAGQSKTLPTSTTPVQYAFKAVPTVATKYTVKVLSSSTTSSTVVAASPTKPVYVVTNQTPTGLSTCGRPVCHETLKVYSHLAKSAYKAESRKKWYFYFGLRLAPTIEPPPPRVLYLDRSATVSKARRISSTEFERTIRFSFRIGNHAYYYLVDFCSKDTEAKDGMNLPGSHSCGVKKIRSTIGYLG